MKLPSKFLSYTAYDPIQVGDLPNDIASKS